MRQEALSARQLVLAAFAGGLAPAAAAAQYGWQGAALALPVLLLGGGAVICLSSRWAALRTTAAGKALRVCYTLWGGVLLSRWLRRCGQRLEVTGGGAKGTAVWIVLLLAAFLLWMLRKKPDVFFRAAELCAPVLLLTAAAVLLWGASRMKWEYAAMPAVSVGDGFWGAVEAGGTLLFALPYIYKVKEGPGDGGRLMAWLAALAAGTVLFALVTAGVLSPAVTALAEEPFFAMTSALGKSFRVEGLVSALWIFSDLMGLSLFARCGAWERAWSPAAVLFFAAAASCFDFFGGVSQMFFGAGTAVLWCATAILLCMKEGNCGRTKGAKTISCGQKGIAKKDQEI